MTTQDKYTRTAMNWLMAVAVESKRFKNEVTDQLDWVRNWGFAECDNHTLETWLNDATEEIKAWYEENNWELV